MTKTCPKCKKSKSFDQYYVNKGRHDGLTSYCKKCHIIQTNKYRKENLERLLEKGKEYYLNNKERLKPIRKKYTKENKAHLRKKAKENYYKNHEKIRNYHNQRARLHSKAKTPENLGRLLRNRLRFNLKYNLKKGSAVKDLGMSVDNFKEYLERLWKPGMSWDNYGTAWHIDHIFPLSRADLTCKYQLRAVCHFTNLQPMWAEDNLRKGNNLASY